MAYRVLRPATAFSKSLRGQGGRKRPREKELAHLKWVSSLPCLISGTYGVQVCHIRYADARYAKPDVGMQEKPDDKWVVPMTPDWHHKQHSMNERKFWESQKIDPVIVAALLWAHSGDDEAGYQIIKENGAWR